MELVADLREPELTEALCAAHSNLRTLTVDSHWDYTNNAEYGSLASALASPTSTTHSLLTIGFTMGPAYKLFGSNIWKLLLIRSLQNVCIYITDADPSTLSVTTVISRPASMTVLCSATPLSAMWFSIVRAITLSSSWLPQSRRSPPPRW